MTLLTCIPDHVLEELSKEKASKDKVFFERLETLLGLYGPYSEWFYYQHPLRVPKEVDRGTYKKRLLSEEQSLDHPSFQALIQPHLAYVASAIDRYKSSSMSSTETAEERKKITSCLWDLGAIVTDQNIVLRTAFSERDSFKGNLEKEGRSPESEGLETGFYPEDQAFQLEGLYTLLNIKRFTCAAMRSAQQKGLCQGVAQLAAFFQSTIQRYTTLENILKHRSIFYTKSLEGAQNTLLSFYQKRGRRFLAKENPRFSDYEDAYCTMIAEEEDDQKALEMMADLRTIIELQEKCVSEVMAQEMRKMHAYISKQNTIHPFIPLEISPPKSPLLKEQEAGAPVVPCPQEEQQEPQQPDYPAVTQEEDINLRFVSRSDFKASLSCVTLLSGEVRDLKDQMAQAQQKREDESMIIKGSLFQIDNRTEQNNIHISNLEEKYTNLACQFNTQTQNMSDKITVLENTIKELKKEKTVLNQNQNTLRSKTEDLGNRIKILEEDKRKSGWSFF